ncbi:hypothetical protein GGI35DRAFT_378240 [Trichoderma velutinum]
MPVIVISWTGCSTSKQVFGPRPSSLCSNGWGPRVCACILAGLFSDSQPPLRTHHSYATRATTPVNYASTLCFCRCAILYPAPFRHMQGGLSLLCSIIHSSPFILFLSAEQICCMLLRSTQPANGISSVYFPFGAFGCLFFILHITITLNTSSTKKVSPYQRQHISIHL